VFMTDNLAPIGIPTYTRLSHLQKTIEALKANPLSNQTYLYIYSDGPKLGDEKEVANMRAYLRTIQGFKSVNIVEQKENNFIKNNYGCIRDLLTKHGKMIFMEDDIVTAQSFIKFMNAALNFYKDDKRILTINGYNIPANFPNDYKHDYFLSKHYNAWGLATWADRNFVSIMERKDGYSKELEDNKLLTKITEVYPALITGLQNIDKGLSDAGDFKIAFHCIKNDMLHIRPVISLVDNIGFDGTGVHCGTTDRYRIADLNQKQNFNFQNIEYDKRMDKIWTKYLDMRPRIWSLPQRAFNRLKRILMRKDGKNL